MCGGPQWKREIVPDHKFDFIDTRDFTDHGCWMRIRYLWVYVLVLKSFLVYVFDIFTAITMLTTQNWSNHIFNSCNSAETNGCIIIPFSIGKWLFVGCIISSFLLLAYEARKTRKIIASRDISYAFTNIMANNYYSLRSYDHFCFFCRINNSTKKKDDFAFFIFFTFKSWKRLLLADGPRQVVNALTLYSFYLSQKDNGPFWDLNKYTDGSLITGALIFSTLTTTVIFIGSALLLLAAGICYIPLLCYIRGNLKEYCCHKVDKRITEIVRRKNKERLAQAAKLAKKEAAGDYSHLKNKKGELMAAPLPQPTLPNVTLDDDDLDDTSSRTRVPPSTYTAQSDYYYKSDYKAAEYPPAMPAYNQQQYSYNQGYAAYPPSVNSPPDDAAPYYATDMYSSSTNLAAAAAPVAHQHDSYGSQQQPVQNGYAADAYDAHAGGAYHNGYGHGQGQEHYGQEQYGQEQYGQEQYGQEQYGQAYGGEVPGGYAYDDRPEYGGSVGATAAPTRSASRGGQRQFEAPAHPSQAYPHAHQVPDTEYEQAWRGAGGAGGYAM